MTNHYAEEKRWVFSFELKEESEKECLRNKPKCPVKILDCCGQGQSEHSRFLLYGESLKLNRKIPQVGPRKTPTLVVLATDCCVNDYSQCSHLVLLC